MLKIIGAYTAPQRWRPFRVFVFFTKPGKVVKYAKFRRLNRRYFLKLIGVFFALSSQIIHKFSPR